MRALIFFLLLLIAGISGWNYYEENQPEALYTRAREAQRVGDLATAQLTYEKLLRKEPDNRRALNNLGAVFIELKQPVKACPLFAKAADAALRDGLPPEDMGTVDNAGRCYFHEMPTRDGEKARPYLEALASRGDVVSLYDLAIYVSEQQMNNSAWRSLLLMKMVQKLGANKPEHRKLFQETQLEQRIAERERVLSTEERRKLNEKISRSSPEEIVKSAL